MSAEPDPRTPTGYLERHRRVADVVGAVVLTGGLWAPLVVGWWSR